MVIKKALVKYDWTVCVLQWTWKVLHHGFWFLREEATYILMLLQLLPLRVALKRTLRKLLSSLAMGDWNGGGHVIKLMSYTKTKRVSTLYSWMVCLL